MTVEFARIYLRTCRALLKRGYPDDQVRASAYAVASYLTTGRWA